MPLNELAQYLIFLLFVPISIISILKGRFYFAVLTVMVALVDLIFLGLKIVGIA